MNYYYYPLCSKDFTFENIFSSESVSPAKVYELRGFGADFCYTMKGLHNSEIIVLYNKPPKFVVSDPNYESLKFILKVSEDSLDTKRLIFISEGVVGYPGTIYLNRLNFELLFFSEKEITIACLRSETSLLTKSYKKYSNNFKIIDESDCVEFKTDMIENAFANQSDLDETVLLDRKFNFFKGYCYGLASGITRSLSKKEIELKRALQDITNCFAEFKNRLEQDNRRVNSRMDIKRTDFDRNGDFSAKVFNAIQKAELLFKELFPGESYSEKELEKYIHKELEKYQFKFEEIELFLKFKKMEDILLGTATLSKVKSSLLNNNKQNPILSFETLRECLRNYSNVSASNTDWTRLSREKSSDLFKQTTFELSKIAESKAAKDSSDRNLDFSAIIYDKEINQINIVLPFLDLDEAIHNEYLIVLNTILQRSKSTKGEAKREDILNLVESVASSLSKNNSGKNTNLYQYLNGEIHEYDHNKVHSIVMKNFVAFVFNPDSLEKLENYLNAREVETKWMSYSFWCSFNGFTNVSRNFVAHFFDDCNNKASLYLDHFIEECFKTGRFLSREIPKNLVGHSDLNLATQTDAGKGDKISAFFERYINGKFKLSLEQFQSVLNLKDRSKMVDELKIRYRIAKKEGVKLIDQFEEILRTMELF